MVKNWCGYKNCKHKTDRCFKEQPNMYQCKDLPVNNNTYWTEGGEKEVFTMIFPRSCVQGADKALLEIESGLSASSCHQSKMLSADNGNMVHVVGIASDDTGALI